MSDTQELIADATQFIAKAKRAWVRGRVAAAVSDDPDQSGIVAVTVNQNHGHDNLRITYVDDARIINVDTQDGNLLAAAVLARQAQIKAQK